MGHIDRKNVLRAFRAIVARTNKVEQERAEKANERPDLIPESLRFHDLRHTHATGLIAAGNSIRAVSRRLGHSNITVTLNVYGQLPADDDSKLGDRRMPCSGESGGISPSNAPSHPKRKSLQLLGVAGFMLSARYWT